MYLVILLFFDSNKNKKIFLFEINLVELIVFITHILKIQ